MLDPETLVAIDVHVHVEQDSHGRFALDQELLDASASYFSSSEHRTPTLAHIAAYYRERRIGAVVFTVDATVATGHPALSSEEIAELAAEHDDVLIPFGSVDPHGGAIAVRQARRLVTGSGVRGFKFHPSLQAFEPNDRRYYPLYEELQALGVVALFHTGQTGIGAGLPGGRGIKLRYSAPMLLDDVAISIATHKANVYIDLSGWSPKYFPPQLVRAANTMLKRKVMFGSDFPLLTPDRWMADFAKLEIRDEIRPKVLKANARKLLNI